MRKWLLAAITATTLVGCASSPDEQAIAVANLRANQLNDIMPLDVGAYQFMRVRSQQTMILVDILYGGGSSVAPSQFLNNSINDYCSSPVIRPALDIGVSYAFSIRDVRGRPIAEQVISAASCE